MNLPEIPSEQQIAEWLQRFRCQIGRYGSTLRRALRSPASLVLSSMCNRSRVVTRASTAPILFAPLTIVVASLLGTIADIVFGVDEPFFSDSSYDAIWSASGDWRTSLQEHLPTLFSASIFLHSLIFAVVLMVIVF